MAYIGTSPSNGVRRVHTYTATAGQTTFTGSSTEGVTLTYADTNYIDVFQNGVLLGSADYTSTSGTSVVLAQGASVSDLVVIVVYDVFSVADTVSKTAGGSFDSAVTMSSTLAVTGETTLNNHINVPDSVELKFGGDADFKISHNGSKTKLEDTGTGNLEIRGTNIEFYSGDGGETLAKLTDDGAAELYHNNTKRIETSSNGVTVFGEDHAIMLSSDSGDGVITSKDTSGSASDDYGDILFSHLRGADDDRTNSLYLQGSNAFVGIGTTGPVARLNVKQNSSEIVYFQNNAGTGVKLTAGNNSFSTVSDENKKENITELDKQKSYDNIKNIRSVNYNYKSVTIEKDEKFNISAETIKDDKTKLGFIAQDWKTNYSEVITTDNDGTLNLSYTDTIPVLLSALQKAQEKIEALEAKVTALENAE